MSRNNNVKILHVTDGARSECRIRWRPVSRAAYASARTVEARLALALAGIDASAIRNMRFTDQRVSFCLEEVTAKFWRPRELTGIRATDIGRVRYRADRMAERYPSA
jgi:hypothetical protein